MVQYIIRISLPKQMRDEIDYTASEKEEGKNMAIRTTNTGSGCACSRETCDGCRMSEEPKCNKFAGLTFGEALQELKAGARVTRSGWNGKGMFVFYNRENGQKHLLADGSIHKRRDYLAIKTADDWIVPWVASQTDILAEDWYVMG